MPNIHFIIAEDAKEKKGRKICQEPAGHKTPCAMPIMQKLKTEQKKVEETLLDLSSTSEEKMAKVLKLEGQWAHQAQHMWL